jgi:hypothetical protein
MQLTLFPERPTIDERFRRFHRANPEVFTLFVRFAREAKARGKQRFGAKAIWERLRWEMSLQTGEAPSLNNDYTACYARLAIETYPEEFAGFFETRRLTHREG